MAMPRSASAGASSRRATRFSAPRGSPAASARAAAVISESIGIPPHLSLPPFRRPVLILRPPTQEQDDDDDTPDRDTRAVAGSAARAAQSPVGAQAGKR